MTTPTMTYTAILYLEDSERAGGKGVKKVNFVQ